MCICIDMYTHIYVTNNQQKRDFQLESEEDVGGVLERIPGRAERETKQRVKVIYNTISVKNRMTLSAWSFCIHLPSPGISGLSPRVLSPKFKWSLTKPRFP